MEWTLDTGVKKWAGTYSGNHSWTLYCGDSRIAMADIPDESVNCVITSPPYYCLRDYKIDGQIGLEETVNEYIDALCNVMDETYRILRKDGLLFLNLGDTYYSGKGKSHGTDPKSNKRRFGFRSGQKASKMIK